MNNKSRFFELILNCPFNDPLKDCVINPYRKMLLSELIEVTSKMNKEEVAALLDSSEECKRKRSL